MNKTTTLFLRFDPAMYTSPRRTYAQVGVRDPARMYTYVDVFSFLHPGHCTNVYMLHARLYSAAQLAELYTSRIVSLHGIPQVISSDRGSIFTSKFWDSFQKAMGTNIRFSTAFCGDPDS